MALPRQKFREMVVQILFCMEFKSNSLGDLTPLLMREHAAAKSGVREAAEFAASVFERKERLDALLAEHSKEYGLQRIANAEKAILRLALFELLESPDVPPKVAISEAVRLTRKFATRDSARFVNAVLDAFFKQHTPPTPAPALPCGSPS